MSILPSRTLTRRPSARFNTRVDQTHRRAEPPTPSDHGQTVNPQFGGVADLGQSADPHFEARPGLFDAYDPPAAVETLVAELPPAPADPGPTISRVEIGVRIWDVETWSDSQWAAIPEAGRPKNVSRATGGWSRLVPVEGAGSRVQLGPAGQVETPEPPTPAEPTEPVRSLADLARAARRAADEARRIQSEQKRLEAELEDLETQGDDAHSEASRIREEMIGRVLTRCGVTGPPDFCEWHNGVGPIASVREGETTFAVYPGDRYQISWGAAHDLGNLVMACNLVISDDLV